jgi:hypothetical protein
MQYAELDKRILKVIAERGSPLYNKHVNEEARRLAAATGRDDFRVIDGRLQALRKAGTIRHLTKSESNGQGGWHVV